MSVELRPLGVKCNIQCQYCYQNPQRDAGNVAHQYDLELMKARVEEEGGGFTLFGGEPLLVKIDDLENLWAWGLEKYGSNGIQTNGTLINESHIALFRKYRVHVGISVDGPGELNDVRWHGSLQRTRDSTEKTHRAIERLCEEGIPPSLIVTLHKNNATEDKLPAMASWFRQLDEMGVAHVRLHILEVDHDAVGGKYRLTEQENISALEFFSDLEQDLRVIRFDIFKDMRRLLLGDDRSSTCVWVACDPYTTRAVRGVEGNGQSSNCGRTNKDGIDFVKSSQEGFERYIALYYTPQEHGGCKGCRFFMMCKGQCPGTATASDWRNKSEYCGVWMSLYEKLERQMLEDAVIPLSASPLRRECEQAMLAGWTEGRNVYMSEILNKVQGRRGLPQLAGVGHGDSHGDSGHGDSHGDSGHGDTGRM